MNYAMIVYTLGQILGAEGLLMVPSLIVSLYYGDPTWSSFLVTIAFLLMLCLFARFFKPKNRVIYAREGFVIVALSWLVMSLFGALPFFLSHEIPSLVDAFFETVSGFTTTGASILTNVEAMSRGLLFWRSFTHWIGGMGVLVFVLAIIPLAGERSMHLMRAEVPGPTVGKLVPKLRSTAMILYSIYLALTIVEILLLKLGGLPWFDCLVNSFGTAGTGGFGIYNASIAHYQSGYIDAVITIFMLVFSVNFSIYHLLLLRHFSQAFHNSELRTFLGIVGGAMLLISLNIMPLYENNFGTAFRYASFQVSSIISTTGFATADFSQWPELSKMILLLLMIVGACAGSTGGGIKVARLIIMGKGIRSEVRRMLHPRMVNHIKMDGKPVKNETVHNVLVFFVAYGLILGVSLLILSLDNNSLETTLSAELACLNNIGPGLDLVGPVGNYAHFSDLAKITLSLNMLLGRLEIFPLVLLFAPSTWRRR